MKIDTKKVEMALMDETIPANLFEKELGISRSAVTRLRKGEREFKNFTIDTAEKIQRWIDENGSNQITLTAGCLACGFFVCSERLDLKSKLFL